MTSESLCVTSTAGLIGSEAVRYFSAISWTVHGVDSGARSICAIALRCSPCWSRCPPTW